MSIVFDKSGKMEKSVQYYLNFKRKTCSFELNFFMLQVGKLLIMVYNSLFGEAKTIHCIVVL